MAKPSKIQWPRMAGLVSIGLFLLFAYVAVTAGSKSVPDEKIVTLYVADALGLVHDSSVMVAGVEVGHVMDLGVAHDKARIRVALRPDETIPRKVRGIVRARSLLGEKFLELVPLEKQAGGEVMRGGEVIQAEDVTKTLELDQFATDFDPLIDRLSGFLNRLNPPDPKAPNLIDNLARATGTLADGLDGKEKQVGDLVDNLNQVTARVDGVIERNSERGGRVFQNLDAVLVDGKRTQIVPRLSEAASSLATVTGELQGQKTVGKLDKVLVRLDPILARAERIDETALRKFLQDEGIKGHVRVY